MAAWRTKAYEAFGFTPGDYSYARGKVDLLADLAAMAKKALDEGNGELLTKIADYVCWAAEQRSEGMASAVDLGFFVSVLRDVDLREAFRELMPASLFVAKWNLFHEYP